MTAIVLMPNIEAIVSAFLRAQPEITAIVDDRVYTAIPGGPVYPLVRVTQFDDVKVTNMPLWVVKSSVQIEGFGGSKGDAWRACATAQSVLAERFHDQVAGGCVVSAVMWGSMRDLPDPTFSPAKPRFVTTAYITAHP